MAREFTIRIEALLGVIVATVLILALVVGGQRVRGEDDPVTGRLPLHVSNGVSCEDARSRTDSVGLGVEPGWQSLCPSGATDYEGGDHEGITCPYRNCPAGEGPYIAANPNRVENQAHLEAVMIHESIHMMKFTGKIDGDPFDECEVDQESERRGADPRYLNYCE